MKLKYFIWFIVICVAIGAIFFPMLTEKEPIQREKVMEEIKIPPINTAVDTGPSKESVTQQAANPGVAQKDAK